MEVFFLYSHIVLRGFVLGVLIAAPVGPIGLLCINRTLYRSFALGLTTGVGAAVADTLFASIAAFGFTAAFEFADGHQTALRFLGGIALLAIAVGTYLTKPLHAESKSATARGLVSAVGSGLFLTLTNPITMIAILAVITGLGGAQTTTQASVLITGVFLGSLAWWVFLCASVSLCRSRIPPHLVTYINWGAAVLLGVFGLYALFSAIKSVLL